MFKKIKPVVDRAKKIVITTHVNPDGDGLGSEIALATYLRSRKKQVKIINVSEVPKQYQFLNSRNEMAVYSAKKHDSAILNADVIFILDVSVSHRLAKMEKPVLESNAKRICVDHHLGNDGLAHYNCIDTKAPATAELIYRMIKQFKGKIDAKIAMALYTAVITDTGNFRFNATLPSTHAMAGELIQLGVKPNDIYSLVYEQVSQNTIRLLGRTLDHLKQECGKEFNWTYLTRKDFKDTGTKPSETEGFVDYTLRLENSKMGAFFYETPEGYTKISLRSNGPVNVQAYASTLGGGGHKNASGITIRKKQPFKPTVDKIVGQLKRYYNANYRAKKK